MTNQRHQSCVMALMAGVALMFGSIMYPQTNPWGKISSMLPQKNDKELRFLRSYPSENEEVEDYLWQPADIAVGERGMIYIIDYKGNSVHIYENSGKHLAKFGRFGQGVGDLSAPVKMKIIKNELVIKESGNKRLQ